MNIYLSFFIFLTSLVSLGQSTSKVLDPNTFLATMRKNENVQLLDIRTPSEWGRGYIKKAINLDLTESSFDLDLKNSFRTSAPLFVYCQSGLKSSQAQEYIADLGFKEVYVLQGGFENWIMKSKPYVANSKNPEPLAFMTIDNFYNKINENKIVIVDFYADWCGPCKKMDPILKNIIESHPHVNLVKINADFNATITERFEIEEIPTLLIFKNGRQIWRHTGISDEKEIKARLQ